MAKRVTRQLEECYYEGYLEKRSFKDKTFQKVWACLCGNKLFFFNDKKDTDYIQKVDLNEFISVTDDANWDKTLSAARLKLQIKDGDIGLTVPSLEARELWKGYIHAVAQLAVPFSLNLLPGQIHMLREVVEKEIKRRKPLLPPAGSTYLNLLADMPTCYYPVSRVEAELLLDRESSSGNLLLRPGCDGSSFAVTTRQDLDSPMFRHYRVSQKPEGAFSIDVDIPVSCNTLNNVINYFVEKTEGVLVPLIIDGTYDKNICFIHSDKENGEKTLQQATSNILPPSLLPKPALRRPSSNPAPKPEQHVYQNDIPLKVDREADDTSAAPATHKKTMGSRAAPLEQTALSELKQALEKRRAVK
ncbi:signal-transducing adaptor protein 2-like isoform X2 [Thalassophryne amazonica]|uniref:signal-transducing adaptor protein 2-like isoform X2 n=1 Tax=Thalassophryne amazonica TaxID=390379 RepID=UPI0014724434|nr:signal-transducing adaptor protein 2-like isoform X2 [Thalassophryne amazonica]